MSATTFRKRRLAIVAIVAGALVTSQVTQADPGDAFERALKNHQAASSFVGHPDAIDRALVAKEASKLAAIDARERGLTERSTFGGTYGPDAFERALITHTDGVTSQKISMLDSRERALGERPPTSSPVAAPDGGFDWTDFSVGAGAGIGLMLVLLGLGVVVIVRRSHARMTTA